MTPAEKELNVAGRLLALEAMVGALTPLVLEMPGRVFPARTMHEICTKWITRQDLQPEATQAAALRHLDEFLGG